MKQVFDVAIIGGGINGCGVAADAALRGLSVILIEQGDLASKTSSSSSKLIHGGLRYLEYYDFKLVKKALDERQRLLSLAPHLVRPIPFIIPYAKNMRPVWLLRTGLFLYDNLSRDNKLPRSKFVQRKQQFQYFAPLEEKYKKGLMFYDCATDDSRLTITNAIQAREHGASIHTYTKLIKAHVENGIWHLTAKTSTDKEFEIRAKTLVNATGPWVESMSELLQIPTQFKLSLVKGSHFVVHKLYEGKHAYLLQHEDKRVIFIVPYQGYTMIGTTDVALKGPLEDVNISQEEVEYLCGLVNNYFQCNIQKSDIIDTWSGVRPLLAASGELKTLSRDYTYYYTQSPAPAVTIYGGKITTYRQLALETVDALKEHFPYLPQSKTNVSPLPGATLKTMSYKDYLNFAREKYFWLLEAIKERYLANYGTNTELLLATCNSMNDLGYDFGNGLYQIEVDYLCHHEWAKSCDDILWRRTKLGLNFSAEQTQTLEEYLLHQQI